MKTNFLFYVYFILNLIHDLFGFVPLTEQLQEFKFYVLNALNSECENMTKFENQKKEIELLFQQNAQLQTQLNNLLDNRDLISSILKFHIQRL